MAQLLAARAKTFSCFTVPVRADSPVAVQHMMANKTVGGKRIEVEFELAGHRAEPSSTTDWL